MGHHDQEQDKDKFGGFPGKDRQQDTDEMAGGGMSGDTGGGMGENPDESGLGGYGQGSGFEEKSGQGGTEFEETEFGGSGSSKPR
jgi:hypothetical protein